MSLGDQVNFCWNFENSVSLNTTCYEEKRHKKGCGISFSKKYLYKMPKTSMKTIFPCRKYNIRKGKVSIAKRQYLKEASNFWFWLK